MGTYKKINGQAVPVTTEGHPQYYFQTKAQAEAALSTLEEGADVFVEEGSNEDVLPRVQELEEDVSQIESDLSVTSDAITIQGHGTTKMGLYKYGKVVFMSLIGDWTSLPYGATNVGTVPSDFRPIANITVCDSPYNAPNVRIAIYSEGTVQAYNYGSAISYATNGNYSACWITN